MNFNIHQIKAAMAFVGLSATDLAEKIGMEQPNLSPILSGKSVPREDTRRRIYRVLQDMGIEFKSDGGISPRHSDVDIYEGVDGWKTFSDDRYLVALNSTQPFLSFGGLESSFASAAGSEFQQFHAARMAAIENFKIRALQPLSHSAPHAVSYVEYRAIPDEHFAKDGAFYVYGGNIAQITFEPALKIYVTRSRAASNVFRTLFEGLWANARPLRGES